MRKISLSIFAAALFLTTNAFAADPIENPSKTLSNQIQSMLVNNNFNIVDDLTADVRFTVNQEGEIVVLSINTESVELEGFVKGRLNYQKVDFSQIEEGKIYTVPVRISA